MCVNKGDSLLPHPCLPLPCLRLIISSFFQFLPLSPETVNPPIQSAYTSVFQNLHRRVWPMSWPILEHLSSPKGTLFPTVVTSQFPQPIPASSNSKEVTCLCSFPDPGYFVPGTRYFQKNPLFLCLVFLYPFFLSLLSSPSFLLRPNHLSPGTVVEAQGSSVGLWTQIALHGLS